ncbi:hypothetical protein C1645_254492 [Glomus cerebriforme]|uniref:Uncharacterized protein n=1 Tax=Glomus cerebriforme TaxID=658196 RepID=A0A397SZ94_9GLOM|nr:hypothetical protein C1645_254492 [Glomus cerebriforme]
MAENICETAQEINNNSAQVSSTSGYSPYKVLYQHNKHNTFSLNNISQNNDNGDDGKAETQLLSHLYQINQQLNQLNAFALDNYHPIRERTPSPIYIVPPSTPTCSKEEDFDFLNSQSLTSDGTSTKELQPNNTLSQMNNINYTNTLPFMSKGTINLNCPIQNQYVNITSTMDTEENT